MLRKKRVVASVVVVAVATIAACLGPSLSSTQQAAVVSQQGSSVDLGNINVDEVGTASITISPASGSQSSSDTITMITIGTCPGWSLTLPPLPAVVSRTCTGSGSGFPSALDESNGDAVLCTDVVYSFDVSYKPSGDGPSSCTITIAGSTFAPLMVTASAVGVAQPFAMDVQPTSINFGDVNLGFSGSQTMTIQNKGTNALNITSLTSNPTPPYSVTQVGGAIAKGATATVTVACAPTVLGPISGTVVVNGDAGSQSVGLQCNGIMSDLNIAPSPVDVTTRVGDVVTRNVTIQNNSGSAVLLSSVTVVPTVTGIPISIMSGPANNTSLGSGASTTVTLRFAPTQAQTPTELARLRIDHQPSTIRDVVINGAALLTTMAVNPDTVDFGAVCAGTTEMKIIEVKAPTPGSFNLSSLTPPAAPFTFTPKTGTTVPGQAMGNQGNKLEFIASVTPTGAGAKVMSQVTLNTDIPGDTAHALLLKADVLPSGIGASPSGMDFGGIMKSTVSSAMSTSVINCSDAPLTITGVTIEGPNGNEFAIVLPPPAQRLVTLQPRESIEYSVIANPTTPGAKVGTLVVVTGTSSVDVALLATALGGGDNGLTGERSYYTCAVGDASGAGLFVVVVVFGLRRRRK